MLKEMLRTFSHKAVITAIGVVAATGLLLSSVDKAHATLIGDNVNISLLGAFFDTVTVVSPGQEVECVDGNGASLLCFSSGGPIFAPGTQFINIEDASIFAQVTSSLVPGTAVFSDLDWLGLPGSMITGVTPVSNLDVFNASHVTFGPDSVTIDLADFVGAPTVGGSLISDSNPATLTINLDVFHPAPTPEPSTMVLLGTGLVGLLGYGWRRKAHTS